MDRLARRPFPAQREAVQAFTRLLLDAGEPAVVLNAEMGTGKTIMAIAAGALMHDAGCRRTLVLSPPHLVYKWRREIKATTPDARVWILNGPDTLQKLFALRALRAVPELRRTNGSSG
ncbi:DEAD/DEAH box helicase family protein [Aromatoleum toluolicum]|nr:DEAD/DEAH box helicase family protein [Aromatoleum toluolicum]MCQ6964055.1 DEAD/DEAH box helicase family protein [Aromatoleum toluolicum]